MTQPLEIPQDEASWRAWADERLRPLDLSVQLMHDVVEAGQRAEVASSPLGPRNGPGLDRWKDTLVAFRTRTGWHTSEEDGLSRTVHPSERFFVVVSTGRNGVGQFSSAVPTPKNGLGSVLQGLIEEPELRQPMWAINGDAWPVDRIYDPRLWLLLTAFHDGFIYCELSQPDERAGDAVSHYATRIQIPPLPFKLPEVSTDEIVASDDDLDGEAGPDIDVRPI